MDHHRLLTILHRVQTACQETTHTRQQDIRWTWGCTPVAYPESHCPFCLHVIRSRGIWFIDEEKGRLIGAFFPHLHQAGPFTFIQPRHPHDTGGGYLCLGHNRSAVALLSSTPNILDSPWGRINIPQWLQTYWDHDCPEMRAFLQALAPPWLSSPVGQVSLDARTRLQELGPAPTVVPPTPIGPIATGPETLATVRTSRDTGLPVTILWTAGSPVIST